MSLNDLISLRRELEYMLDHDSLLHDERRRVRENLKAIKLKIVEIKMKELDVKVVNQT